MHILESTPAKALVWLAAVLVPVQSLPAVCACGLLSPGAAAGRAEGVFKTPESWGASEVFVPAKVGCRHCQRRAAQQSPCCQAAVALAKSCCGGQAKCTCGSPCLCRRDDSGRRQTPAQAPDSSGSQRHSPLSAIALVAPADLATATSRPLHAGQFLPLAGTVLERLSVLCRFLI